jgi:hypothetical protein
MRYEIAHRASHAVDPATLNPINEAAPVPGGIDPVSAMKISPIEPKSELGEKSNRFAEE